MVGEEHERVERLTEALRRQTEHWRLKPLVAALSSLRGIDFVAAVTLAAEIGDFSRFAHPCELMGFLGTVPSEYSTGDTQRQGDITKTGNSHARRVLVEAAWNYRFPRVSVATYSCARRASPKRYARSPGGHSCAWRIAIGA